MKMSLKEEQALYDSANKCFLLGELINKDSVECLTEAGCNGLACELIAIGNTIMSLYENSEGKKDE